MKIGYLRLDLTIENGDNRMLFSLTQALQKIGHEVVIYTIQFSPHCFPELNHGLNIKVVKMAGAVLPISNPGRGSLLRQIKERLERERAHAQAASRLTEAAAADRDFDILIAQNDYSYQIGKSYKKINPDCRFVWIMNNAPFYHLPKKNWLANLLSLAWAYSQARKVRRCLSGIDLIVVNDRGRREMVKRALGKDALILRIAVDFGSFFSEVKQRSVGGKSVVLLDIGSLSPMRKFEDVISAGAGLRKIGYEARVILICKDYLNDGEYRRLLVDLAKKSEMDKFTDFYFEGVSDKKLREIQKGGDVFVLPARIDVWAMSAPEAMAAGLPLIVSGVASAAEILSDGKNALFTEPGNIGDIIQKIRALADNPEFYKKIASAGQQFVKENLDWDAYAKNLLVAVNNK